MRRLITLIALVTMTLVVPTATSATAAATSRVGVVSFRLAPPDRAVAPTQGMMAAPGDSIEVTGGGTVTLGGAVDAKGGFVHHNADGTVHCQGWWKAAVTGWTDFGGGHDGHGRHGGVLSLEVTHYCTTMGEVHTNIPMTVTSTRNAPPASAYVEGTTVAEFSVPTGGGVRIWTR